MECLKNNYIHLFLLCFIKQIVICVESIVLLEKN